MTTAQNILVFGATSAICHAVLKLYADRGARLFLTGRNADRLGAIGDDLVTRGAELAGSAAYDFSDWQRHGEIIEHAHRALGTVDLVLVAHGTLPEQAECEASDQAVRDCMENNFTSTAIIMHAVARLLATQGSGCLAVFSSVAGDRGRKSNYSYGAAKAGIDALLQGMRGRFDGTAVQVVNIKPGMVISPMTADMQHGALWATPDGIAPAIVKAIAAGKQVCYVPGFWRLIMLVIRSLPTTILAKLPI